MTRESLRSWNTDGILHSRKIFKKRRKSPQKLAMKTRQLPEVNQFVLEFLCFNFSETQKILEIVLKDLRIVLKHNCIV